MPVGRVRELQADPNAFPGSDALRCMREQLCAHTLGLNHCLAHRLGNSHCGHKRQDHGQEVSEH